MKFLPTSLVLSIVSTSFSTFYISHIALIKLVAIFVILYRLAHHNNRNYIFSLIIIHLYLAGIQVNAITLFNYFRFSILYNIFMEKSRNIIISNIIFIKK